MKQFPRQAIRWPDLVSRKYGCLMLQDASSKRLSLSLSLLSAILMMITASPTPSVAQGAGGSITGSADLLLDGDSDKDLNSSNSTPMKDTDLPTFSTTDVDLGSIDEAEREIRIRFRWTNSHPQTIHIKSIAKSCRCTSVSESRTTIQPDQSVDFNVVMNLDGIWGHATGGFGVSFGDGASPIDFGFRFFRPMPPTIEPPEICLNQSEMKAGSISRLFRLVAVGAKDEKMSVTVKCERLNSGLSIDKVYERRFIERLTQGATPSVRHVYLFSVKSEKLPDAVQLVERILVKIESGNKDRLLVLPVTGVASSKLRVQPMELLVLSTSEPGKWIGNSARVFCGEGAMAGNSIVRVRAESDQIDCTFNPSTEANAPCLGEIVVTPKQPGKLDTMIKLECINGTESHVLTLPIRVRTIDWGRQDMSEGSSN
jgi:hypothetical protein